MARRESAVIYSAAGWSNNRVSIGLHRIHQLTLKVRHGNNPVCLELGFRIQEAGDIEKVRKIIRGLEPRFEVLGIDFHHCFGTLMNDWAGKEYLYFRQYTNGLRLRSDKVAGRFLNKVAGLLGYPAINEFVIQREYDVPAGVHGDLGWISEGSRLAEQLGG